MKVNFAKGFFIGGMIGLATSAILGQDERTMCKIKKVMARAQKKMLSYPLWR